MALKTYSLVSLCWINWASIRDHRTKLRWVYPAAYVIERVGPEHSMTKMEFAGEAPFVNIFNVRGNIVNLDTITMDSVQDYYDRIRSYIKRLNDGDDLVRRLNSTISYAKQRAQVKNVPGGLLWYVTKTISEYISNVTGRSMTATWNTLFRNIGIDGVIDAHLDQGQLKGYGIIHHHEPCQAVFFTSNVIGNNMRIHNKYAPYRVDIKKRAGNRRADIVKATNPEEIVNILKQMDVYDAKLFSRIKDPELRLSVIKRYPQAIHGLDHPTDAEIQAVLDMDLTHLVVPEHHTLGFLIRHPKRELANQLSNYSPRSTTLQQAIVDVDPTLVSNFIDVLKPEVANYIINQNIPISDKVLLRRLRALARKYQAKQHGAT